MTALTPRDRRAVTLGVAVLGAAFALAFGVRPALASLAARRDAAAQAQELLDRERALLTEAPTLPAQIATRRAALAQRATRVVRSDQPETAALTLATRLRSVAREAEVRLLDVSDAPADTLPGALTIARVTIRGESDVRGLLRFVRAVEGERLDGRFAALTITPSSSRVAGGSADADAHLLMVTATVEVPVVPAVADVQRGSAAPEPIVDRALDGAVLRTIADNPFAPDRVPGPVFRAVAAPVTTVTAAAPVQVRLIGTVVAGAGRSFVMCVEGSGAAKVVYVGGRIGALTLRSIEQGMATFTDGAGRAVVLRVPRGGE
jgi:hypothetical protein